MKTGALLLALAGSGIAAVTGAAARGPAEGEGGDGHRRGAGRLSRRAWSTTSTPRPGAPRAARSRPTPTRRSRGAFAADLEARRLEWQAVNVDEPANQHFIRDFQLYTRSVVIVDAKDPKRFKVLDRVWQLVRDKPAFQKYVEQEIRAFRRS